MKYYISLVHNKIDSKLRQDIINLWLSCNVLDKQQAYSRVKEVVAVGYDENGKLIGITTAYSRQFSPLGGNWFFYRMFIDPSFRGRKIRRNTPGFFTETYSYLKKNYPSSKGVVAVLENNKISDKLMHNIYKFNYLGLNPQGLKVWFKHF